MTTVTTTALKKISPERLVKFALAMIIIVMGGYGYYRFFGGSSSNEPVWMVVTLFVIIEITMLTMTTKHFTSTLLQAKRVSFGLAMALLVMAFISGVGIDQTIWAMVESKYHNVKKDETAMEADRARELFLLKEQQSLQKEQELLSQEMMILREQKVKFQKTYRKNARQLKDIIWYNGKRCDLSVDCTSRREVAENTLDLVKQSLDELAMSMKLKQEKMLSNDQMMRSVKDKVDLIVQKRVAFEKASRVMLENKKDEGIVHVGMMHIYNKFFTAKIETPERVYVLLLSFIVYPIYILFIIFLASSSPEQQQRLAEVKAKKRVSKMVVYYLRKLIAYMIATRVRKVKKTTVTQEVEVIKEVEKVVYKEGKEIVKVEVEVPHIIEKEVVVERVVEKPVVQKEFVVVPTGYDLNELNKLTGGTIKPTTLSALQERMGAEKKGVNDDQYRVA